MKRTFLLLTFVLVWTGVHAILPQDTVYKYKVVLTGASFASPQNTWFEQGCEAIEAKAINRAIGGEAIANTANRMIDGTLYSAQEFEEMDALVIMQVHDKDVADETQLKENYRDYKTPFDRSNYAAAYDYVIKRYLSECYALRSNPKSKYYNTPTGKPAIIVLCTHWHDSRVIYNDAIRKLAAKWGLPLVEFDKNIGFSRNVLHPVTKHPISRLYANDTQEIRGIVYGHHPIRGRDSYIQKRMASIFADAMKKVLPVR